ncbi:hypothetical protein T11_16828 [Trichinella zimbabwensis]|uniref:Uncharacterized protein n=1 Tax=Trichinella zimbabwensis TaxID=268475 RepID=A0A0V1GWN4_9BILA|nr:hypothetical protein T11_16828 [Trichinella zimbabwensis]
MDSQYRTSGTSFPLHSDMWKIISAAFAKCKIGKSTASNKLSQYHFYFRTCDGLHQYAEHVTAILKKKNLTKMLEDHTTEEQTAEEIERLKCGSLM